MDVLRINDDFSKRVVVRPENYEWQPSPILNVERMMLDRIGGEVARATTLVRYQRNSSFTSHTHNGGEEIFVIEGVFSDEHGDYPKGTYIRNPVGTKHTPKIGDEGATIFVKLHQFSANDTQQKIVDTTKASWSEGNIPGLTVLPLHNFQNENVALVCWQPYTHFTSHTHLGGEEIFVIDGVFYDDHGCYPKGSWIRSPHMSKHEPYTKNEGAIIYVKVGHLAVEHSADIS
ncbi:cupin domain-containing protein [Candidatus Uabimicrobium sp. HlEnr_7]|uniref:cupin domain-containing protein n=1 Tax=Candidatus Uabimicrobium helgolandensis TaxID=3095367 RepID=UPI0035565DEB